jgi:hypothetical protein
MENVYILYHLAKSKLKKKGGKIYALFVAFRVAFDKVHTEKMREREREK